MGALEPDGLRQPSCDVDRDDEVAEAFDRLAQIDTTDWDVEHVVTDVLNAAADTGDGTAADGTVTFLYSVKNQSLPTGTFTFQVTDVVVEPLGLPDWFASMVVMLGLLGFPVAAVLAWIFDITPSGVVRNYGPAGTSAPPSARRWTDLALDTAMILVALAICGMLIVESFSFPVLSSI